MLVVSIVSSEIDKEGAKNKLSNCSYLVPKPTAFKLLLYPLSVNLSVTVLSKDVVKALSEYAKFGWV